MCGIEKKLLFYPPQIIVQWVDSRATRCLSAYSMLLITSVMEHCTPVIGLLAGALTTISFVPQVVRVWRTKHTRDLSLGMFIAMSSGVALWLCYGVIQHDIAVILANSVTLPLALYIVVMKLKHG